MRDLRSRLNALTSHPAPQKQPEPVRPRSSLYTEEHFVEEEELHGVRQSRLEEVLSCDPAFAGTSWAPERLLFFDTETTGLGGGAGTVAFEIGLAWLEPSGLRVRQMVLRDYDQEPEMLERLVRLLNTHDILVSYNGKSFDAPLLESRMILNGFRVRLREMPHLDLLHICRRVYGLRLKRCTLPMLESAVLDKNREDDLPGSEAPGRFFTFLKTGEFGLLRGVLDHNLEDVVSLAQLTGHLCSVFREPETLTHPEDMLGVAKTLERTGDRGRAGKYYRMLGYTSVSPEARFRLGRMYKTAKDWMAAEEVWKTMAAQGQNGAEPCLELSRYYEHTAHDLPKALFWATEALNRTLDRGVLHPSAVAEDCREIRKRIERLQKKQRNGSCSGPD